MVKREPTSLTAEDTDHGVNMWVAGIGVRHLHKRMFSAVHAPKMKPSRCLDRFGGRSGRRPEHEPPRNR